MRRLALSCIVAFVATHYILTILPRANPFVARWRSLPIAATPLTKKRSFVGPSTCSSHPGWRAVGLQEPSLSSMPSLLCAGSPAVATRPFAFRTPSSPSMLGAARCGGRRFQVLMYLRFSKNARTSQGMPSIATSHFQEDRAISTNITSRCNRRSGSVKSCCVLAEHAWSHDSTITRLSTNCIQRPNGRGITCRAESRPMRPHQKCCSCGMEKGRDASLKNGL